MKHHRAFQLNQVVREDNFFKFLAKKTGKRNLAIGIRICKRQQGRQLSNAMNTNMDMAATGDGVVPWN